MFAGTTLSIHLLVYAGLSLFIISGPYLYMVVCVLYAYNLTKGDGKSNKILESLEISDRCYLLFFSVI